jgi:uncharacterized membrane protein
LTLASKLSHFFGFGPGQPRLGRLSIRQWVWIFVLASVAIQLYISYLSTMEFRQNAGDLGIVMQALSNTGSGRFFWAAAPYLHYGTISLLNIHFSWVYFVMFPLYSIRPGETLLFVAQAIAIALAMVPLQFLAEAVSGSARKGLVVAGLYLLWAPMYAGLPNSFHLEAFLPIEFFTLVLLWYRKQYGIGLVLAALTGFTLDVAPILTALVGIMFLTYPLADSLRSPPVYQALPAMAALRRWASRFFRRPEVQAGLALVALSVAVFYAMRYLEADFPAWLGYHGGSLGVNRIVGYSPSNLTVNFDLKVEFWLVMLGTVGFLPLLYPRSLIILVPWIGYTFTESAVSWYQIPSHYVAIVAVPLFIGVAFGVAVLPSSFRAPSPVPSPRVPPGAAAGGPSMSSTDSDSISLPEGSRPRRALWLYWGDGMFMMGFSRSRSPAPGALASTVLVGLPRRSGAPAGGWAYVAAVLLVVAVFAANIGLNPLNPETAPTIAADNTVLFGGVGNSYGLTLSVPPGYHSVARMASLVPPRATVLVQAAFYPMVSRDPNAYPYNSAFEPRFVPFNNTTHPEYVLATRGGLGQLNGYTYAFSTLVWDQSTYGLLAWVQSSRLNSVYLFELGYTGATLNLGPVTYLTLGYPAGAGLQVGTAGKLSTASYDGAKKHVVVSAINDTGPMWTTSDATESLPGADYTVNVVLMANGTATNCSAVSAHATLMTITGNVPGITPVLTVPVTFAELPCGTWVSLSLPLTLQHPVDQFDLHGTLPGKKFPLVLSVLSVTMAPVAPLPS